MCADLGLHHSALPEGHLTVSYKIKKREGVQTDSGELETDREDISETVVVTSRHPRGLCQLTSHFTVGCLVRKYTPTQRLSIVNYIIKQQSGLT